MVIFGQYLEVVLAAALIFRLFQLGVASKYKGFLVFIACDSLECLFYMLFAGLEWYRVLDYRAVWCVMQMVSWITTIWMVYALLVAILSRLPGIRKFSVGFLNGVFGLAILFSFVTVRLELASSSSVHDTRWLVKVSGIFHVLERGLSLAELIALLSTLIFILFFPIRVPQNLARFAVGLSVYLLLSISFLLIRSYFPEWQNSVWSEAAPGYVSALCLLYWVLAINAAGEKTDATLGRNWKAVPQEHLVRQLEALNAALLRSREQA